MDEQLRWLPDSEAIRPLLILRDVHVLLHSWRDVQAGLGPPHAAHILGIDSGSLALQPEALSDDEVPQ